MWTMLSDSLPTVTLDIIFGSLAIVPFLSTGDEQLGDESTEKVNYDRDVVAPGIK